MQEFGTLSLDSLVLVDWIATLEDKCELGFDIGDLDTQELGNPGIGDVLAELLNHATNS